MTLHRSIGIPLYRQLSQLMADAIASGEFAPDERLPTEAELAARYDVNRLTVRQALGELARAGLVVTIAGRGSFVARPPSRYTVSSRDEASLTRAMAAQGRTVTQTLLDERAERASGVREALGVRGKVRRFLTLREVDGQPWSLTTTMLSEERLPGLRRVWTGDRSLFDALAEHYGIRMRRGDRSFTATPALPPDAEHLLLPVGAPLLVMRGANLDDDGRPVVLVEHRFRGDRTEYNVEMA